VSPLPYQYRQEPLSDDKVTWLANACETVMREEVPEKRIKRDTRYTPGSRSPFLGPPRSSLSPF